MYRIVLQIKVEFRCEFSPKKITVFVEKDTKAKEVICLLYSSDVVTDDCGDCDVVMTALTDDSVDCGD